MSICDFMQFSLDFSIYQSILSIRVAPSCIVYVHLESRIMLSLDWMELSFATECKNEIHNFIFCVHDFPYILDNEIATTQPSIEHKNKCI